MNKTSLNDKNVTGPEFWHNLAPLWPDERIKQVVQEIIHPDNVYMAALQNTVAYLLLQMRDEYEATFDLLRAENNMLFDRAAQCLPPSEEYDEQ